MGRAYRTPKDVSYGNTFHNNPDNDKMTPRLLVMIFSIGVMVFAGIVSETAMNVAFATLMEEFSIGTGQVQWVTTAYILVITCVVPITSYLNKAFTDKQNFMLATISCLIGCVVCLTAVNFPMLVLGRVIAGIGAGIAIPLMYNIILAYVPFRIQGTMFGVANVICSISPAFGPPIAGVVIAGLSWRFIFVILIILMLISIVMGMLSIPKGSAPQKRPAFDRSGYALLCIVLAAIILGAGMAGTYGWLSIPVIGLFVIAVLFALFFYRHYKRCKEPIIRIRIFRSMPFLCGALAVLCLQFSSLSQGVLIPNYSQLVNGQTTAVAGMLIVPGSVLCAILMPVSGRIYDKKGPRTPFVIGSAGLLLGMFLGMVLGMRLNSALMIAIYLFYGVGIGSLISNLQGAAFHSLPKELSSDGTAMFNTMQQLGGALGTAAISFVIAAAQTAMPDDLSRATAAGSRNGYTMLFVIACVVVFCLCVILRSLKKKNCRA